MTSDKLYAISAAVGNHLWQSTLFALIVAALTLAMRKNRAAVRYRLWLGASLKFLVPFSALMSIGGRLARTRNATEARPAFYFVMQTISEPFKHATQSQGGFLIALLWLGGFVFFLSRSWLRWRRVASAVRAATPVSSGREVDALQRLQQAAGVRWPVALRISESSLEPGIFGIFRTTLLWPASISAHLEEAHLDAILAHEIEHVRRRDNLAATVHMLVEAVVWFHPLVWWLGAHLVEERERACDEAVIGFGSPPHIYAESILRTCKFCVSSPVACVSGVTGGPLKERIVRIMTHRSPDNLTFPRKLLLSTIGLATLVGPICLGLLQSSRAVAQPSAVNAGTEHDEPGRIYSIGKDVKAPELLFAPDPKFSEQALRAKLQGVCVIAMIVDDQGRPQRVHAVRHLGMGLDEKAVEAVRQYKFTPAMRFGKPVAVEVKVEVNFRRY